MHFIHNTEPLDVEETGESEMCSLIIASIISQDGRHSFGLFFELFSICSDIQSRNI